MDFYVGVQDGHHVPFSDLPSRQSGLSEAQLLRVPDFPHQAWMLLVDVADIFIQVLLQILCKMLSHFSNPSCRFSRQSTNQPTNRCLIAESQKYPNCRVRSNLLFLCLSSRGSISKG